MHTIHIHTQVYTFITHVHDVFEQTLAAPGLIIATVESH